LISACVPDSPDYLLAPEFLQVIGGAADAILRFALVAQHADLTGQLNWSEGGPRFRFHVERMEDRCRTMRPNPIEMTDFNILTLNARVFPGTAPLVAKYGDRVRIRFGNLSAMEHHPIHNSWASLESHANGRWTNFRISTVAGDHCAGRCRSNPDRGIHRGQSRRIGRCTAT
jgi:hypothetical protein